MAEDREGEAPRALGADLVIPALALAFAIYFFFSIADLGWEAKANGVLIGTLLVGLIVLQAGRIAIALARGRGSASFDPLVLPREALPQRFGIVAVTVGFIASLPWLGLTLGLFVWMMAGLFAMGLRRMGRILAIAAASAAIAYLMFILLLKSEFPHGPVEHGIAAAVAALRS